MAKKKTFIKMTMDDSLEGIILEVQGKHADLVKILAFSMAQSNELQHFVHDAVEILTAYQLDKRGIDPEKFFAEAERAITPLKEYVDKKRPKDEKPERSIH